jgi:hypothetical protein
MIPQFKLIKLQLVEVPLMFNFLKKYEFGDLEWSRSTGDDL